MSRRVLLIGFGNPGRLDDGLGPALADLVEKARIRRVTVDSNYQLTVEDAAQIAEHDLVVFADASVSGNEPFGFEVLTPKSNLSFSTHSVSPEAVLGLTESLFNKKLPAYLLTIRGYEFNEFGERLSEAAQANLAQAVQFISGLLREYAGGNLDCFQDYFDKKADGRL